MNCISLFRVSRAATVAIYTDVRRPLSSREYRAIIRMVEIDLETSEEDECREAQRRFSTGSLEAMCRALKDAMGDVDGGWRDYATAAAHALVNMPASAIEARRAIDSEAGVVEDESAVPQGDAQTQEFTPNGD